MKNVAKIIMARGGLQGLCVVEEDGTVSRGGPQSINADFREA